MADLGAKIKFALDESRMLVLGSQVLLGFQFRSFFEKRFNELPDYARNLKLASTVLMIGLLMLLILPAVHHRIVERGEDTVEQHRFTTTIMDFTLLPFAIAIGLDTFLAFDMVLQTSGAIVGGVAITLLTLFLWYGWQWLERSRHGKPREETKPDSDGRTPLKNKIEHVLTECRVVLPGVQALLGFALATMLMEEFDKLPASSKLVHLGALMLIALAMILLMMPAAYHRIVEEGEETERFHRFAGTMILAALIPLTFGVSADLYVILRKLTHSVTLSATAAGVTSGVMLACWFGVTMWIRTGRRKRIMEEAADAV